MCNANYWYIWRAFSILEQLEAEQGCPIDIDPDDEQSVKHVYQVCVVPWYSRLAESNARIFKVALAYFLKKHDFSGLEVLENTVDLTMAKPTHPRLLFVWMWEVLFPTTSVNEIDTSNVQEDNDAMQLNDFY